HVPAHRSKARAVRHDRHDRHGDVSQRPHPLGERAGRWADECQRRLPQEELPRPRIAWAADRQGLLRVPRPGLPTPWLPRSSRHLGRPGPRGADVAADRGADVIDHVDVLIVGAGISGIGLGHHLRKKQPDKTFAIVDGRDAIGGTWDLFRYPGIRSDSDLHTFGFEFKPWTRENAIANGDEILDYLHETVAENDLAGHMHLGHKVLRADFSSGAARWTVTLERTSDGEQFDVTCGVLFSAAGYYDYARGHTPDFEGREDFGGQIVHPQDWPQDLDYAGKRVVIIGSGATAVTILPAMAETAGHVTMLQRSPTYILPVPRQA